jgi:thiamine-monophosphate kinase
MVDEWRREESKPRPTRNRAPSAKRTKIGGEFDFIRRLQNDPRRKAQLALDNADLRRGIGDDAAVTAVRSGFESVVTTDLLVEEIDFVLDRSHTSARDLGHKALAVSLSDIAAMGARPRWSLLSIGVPRQRFEDRFFEELYKGFYALAEKYGVELIGGDISRTPDRVVIDSILIGEVRRARAVLRSGAAPGDQIFVTGSLGGAAAGLRLLQVESAANENKPARAERKLIERQNRPSPRVEWGRLLGEKRLATAMIDVSDGLSLDLSHICRESGVGARIDASTLPIDPSIERAGFGDQALAFALNGGEDFELLFTVRPREASKIPDEASGVSCVRIGEVTRHREKLVVLIDGEEQALSPQGFDHFR